MTMTRILRREICRLLIGVIVSTQLAVAAYACSGTARITQLEQIQPANAAAAMAGHNGASPVSSYPGAAANQGAMGFGGLDPALPNLCAAHYQYGQQSADHAPAPAVPAALLTSLYTLAPPGDSSGYVGSRAGPSGLLAVADPPHAVLHCCLRT
ncbi:MAG: hypothetical protein EPN79_04250 [Burkholderiaceae bacterium]|nr:MAG: hypothetical protein EPN79_04250 [Burkholderiaceae bacterium]TBR76388.1 MAG: hypothetical protein EPN64_07875 [Burkholderiaceae bacterium]